MDPLYFWINIVIITFGEMMELTVIIFLTTEFRKKHSDLQKAFYYVLYAIYVFDSFSSIPRFVMRVLGQQIGNPVVATCQVIMWYYYYTPGICEFVLALNRCTGIAFPTIHHQFWTGARLKCVLLLIVAFPLLVSGYTLSNFHCRMYPFDSICAKYTNIYVLTVIFINTGLSVSALLVIILGILRASKVVTITKNSVIAQLERKMVVYQTISTTLLTLRYICSLLSYFHKSYAELFDTIGLAFYYLQHYLPIMLLPILNSTYRNKFMKFLGCRKGVIHVASTMT
uniref:Vomeronasal type-1 receptor n=1 Tax=Panagrellus redivivus TaxID=6233 RepID=A0A7E4UPK7_PANRE